MVSTKFDVIRCNSCNNHSGRMSSTPKSKCTRCGSLMDENAQVVDSTNGGTDLQNLVAYYNMPEELRGDFKKMEKSKLSIDSNLEISNKNDLDENLLLKILKQSINSDGIVTEKSISKSLSENSLKFDPISIIEQIEYDGYLVRVGHNKWKIID